MNNNLDKIKDLAEALKRANWDIYEYYPEDKFYSEAPPCHVFLSSSDMETDHPIVSDALVIQPGYYYYNNITYPGKGGYGGMSLFYTIDKYTAIAVGKFYSLFNDKSYWDKPLSDEFINILKEK